MDDAAEPARRQKPFRCEAGRLPNLPVQSSHGFSRLVGEPGYANRLANRLTNPRYLSPICKLVQELVDDGENIRRYWIGRRLHQVIPTVLNRIHSHGHVERQAGHAFDTKNPAMKRTPLFDLPESWPSNHDLGLSRDIPNWRRNHERDLKKWRRKRTTIGSHDAAVFQNINPINEARMTRQR